MVSHEVKGFNQRTATKTKLIVEAVIRCGGGGHDAEIKERCKSLMDSMPKRVEQFIKNRGGYVTY